MDENLMEQPDVIVLGAGEEYEKVVRLKPPQGKMARRKMPRVLDFMKKLEKLQNKVDKDADSGDRTVAFMMFLWDNPEFEESILPFTLQMESPEDLKWLEEHGLPLEIVSAFMKAAQFLVEKSLAREDVSVALKKSDNGELVEN